MSTYPRRLPKFLSLAAVSLLSITGISQAQTFSNNFGDANAIWTQQYQWGNYTAPISSNATTLTFTALDGLSYTNAAPTGGAFVVNNLTFNNTGLFGNGGIAINNGMTFDAVGAGAATISNNGQGNITINGTNTFAAGNPTLQLQFNGTGTGTVNLSGILSGGAGNSVLVNTHTLGITTLSGVNTFGGGVTLQQGILNLVSNTGMGTGALTVTGNNTLFNSNLSVAGNIANNIVTSVGNNLNITGSTTFATFTGTTSGSGDVVLNSGIIVMSNTNTYTGATKVFGGRMIIAGNVPSGGLASALGSSTSAIQLGRSYGQGGLNGASQLFLDDGVTATTGGLLVSGSFSQAELNFGGTATPGTTAITVSRPVVVNAGSGGLVSINNGGGTGGTVTFDNNASLTLNRPLIIQPGVGMTFNGTISGPGSLFFNLGTATLNGTNTYSGGTIIENTAITIANGSAFGTGPIYFGRVGGSIAQPALSGSITINNRLYLANTLTIGTLFTGAFAATFSGSADYNITQPITGTGLLNLSMTGGVFNLLGNSNTIYSLISTNTTSVLDLNGNTLNIGYNNFGINTTTGGYQGTLQSTGGGGSVLKYGTNLQVLTGTASPSQLIIHQGTISFASIVGSGNGLFAGTTLTVNTGGALTLDNTNAVPLAGRLSGGAIPINLNAGTINLIGNATTTTAQTAGTLNLTGFGTETITATAAAGGTTLTFNSLNRVANGGGTLRARAANLGAAIGANNGNILFTTAPTLFGGGGAAGSTTVSVLPYGIGGITAADVGTNFLTYNNTTGLRPLVAAEYAAYTGLNSNFDNVRISAAPTGTLAGQNINTLMLDSAAQTVGFVAPGSGTLTLGNAGNPMSALLITGSTNNLPVLVNGFSSIAFNGEAIIHQTNTATLGGLIASPISTSNGFTKSGASNLFLTANNTGTLSGPVVVSGGTLINSVDTQLGTNSNNLVLNGGSFLYNPGGTVSLPRQLIIGPGGGTFNVSGNTDVSVSGITNLSGFNAGSLIKAGVGTLTLSGTNVIGNASTGGRVSITGGVLSIPDESVLGSVPVIAFEAGGNLGPTLRITGNNVTINKNIVLGPSASGGYLDIPQNVTIASGIEGANGVGSGVGTNPSELVKIGAGTLTLNNINPFFGPLGVLQGGLTLNGNGSVPFTTGTSISAQGTVTGTSSTAGTLVGFGATLTLDNTGTNNADRLSDTQALRLQGGNLVFRGNNSATSVETVNSLILENGSFSTVTVTPGTNQYANFGFTTLGFQTTSLSAGLLVRGANLGAVPTAGQTTAGITLLNASTSAFTQLPVFGGGGARGTQNISILPGVIGDFSDTGSGTTFVTVEGPTSLATGLRPLAASEFVNSFNSSSRQFTINTANVSLSSGVVVNGPSQINSLILTGSAGLSGSGLLNISSGNLLTTTGATGTIANGGLVFGALSTGGVTTGFNTTAFLMNNADLTISAPIYGNTGNTFGIIKAGVGNLTLSGNNSVAGNVSVTAGQLTVGSSAALNRVTSVTVYNGATLSLNGLNTTVGNISGYLNNTVNITNLALGGGSIDIAGATLTFGLNNGSTAFGGVIQGAGNLVRNGTATSSGILQLINANTYSGSTTINNGQITLVGTNGSLPNTSSINIAGGTLLLDNAEKFGTSSFNAARFPSTTPVSLSGSLTFTGSSNALTAETIGNTASGLNFQGGAIVTAQGGSIAPTQLTLGNAGSGAINRSNNATVLFRGTNLGISQYAATAPASNPIITGVFPGSANIYFTSAPTGLVGGGGAAGSTTMSIIPWAVGDVTAAGTGTTFLSYDPVSGLRPLNTNATLGQVEFATQAAITENSTTTNNVRMSAAWGFAINSSTTTVNSVINNGFSITSTGSGVNTSNLAITSGALLINGGVSVTSSANIVFGSAEGIVHVASGSTMTFNAGLSGTNGLTKGGAGTIVINTLTTNTTSGGLNITGGILQVNDVTNNELGLPTGPSFGRILFSGPFGSPQLTYAGTTTATLARDLVFATGSGTISYATTTADLTLAGTASSTNPAISGLGTLIKAGAGRIILADNDNSASFSGATRIDAGQLRITRDVNLGAGGDFILNGGTVELASAAATWSTNRPVYFSAASTIDMRGGSINWSGPVSGISAGAITVSSSTTTGGRLTLSGSNTLNTSFTVSSGAILTAASNNALGLFTQNVSVSSGGTLEVTGGINMGPKPISLNGTGFSGSGAIRNVAGTNTLNGIVTLATASTIQVDATSSLNLMGNLSGSTTLTKTGTGTLSLAAAAGNTFTGSVTVSAGKLMVNNQAGSAVNNTVTVAAGASLGGSGSVQAASISNGGTLTPGNSPGMLTLTGTAASTLTLASGAIFEFEINNATGGRGTNWDVVNAPSTTAAIVLPASMVINITGLDATNAQGVVPTFSNANNYFWTFAQASGGFSGFNPANFVLNSANFTSFNPLGGGVFGVIQTGNELQITFTAVAVPEPLTMALLGASSLGIAGAYLYRRRRLNSLLEAEVVIPKD